MQSFRTELENPVVAQDIIDLERKISLFHEGKIDEEKFRSLRLARGVYGQRQPGVQMIRIKIPYGKVTFRQLRRIADIADEYGSGNLHATTRQDIQIHYVSLDRTPELWAKLEQDEITLREACGNTVRNITASPYSGIDPAEPFDVTPHADAMFRYFLRNPVNQEMGRKIKISFSNSDADTGLSYIHDLGFIPKVRTVDGKEQRGFKVLLGGGLGAQPMAAQVAEEFLPEDQIIPFAEAILRVFDRHGERSRRMKARMKFLMADIGLEGILSLAKAEWKALKNKSVAIDTTAIPAPAPGPAFAGEAPAVEDEEKYTHWRGTNVREQKQQGFYSVAVRVLLGDLKTDRVRQFVAVAEKYAADDIRITANQGYILKYVRPEALPALFTELDALGLAEPGFDSTADITACPGTDSCNLAISSSTGIARKLEEVINEEYPSFVYDQQLKIKISGCPNSCGQHSLAGIGLHGSSLKHKTGIVPAMQIVLGGGTLGDGVGLLSEKVIKVPSKRAPQALRMLLDDYLSLGQEGEYFHDYFQRQGKMYFYQLLKPLTDVETLVPSDFIDWGHEAPFAVETGTGECAGVIIDLVATLLLESEEKEALAQQTLDQAAWADSIYHSYAVFVNSAKALLLTKGVTPNTHARLLSDFDEHFVQSGDFHFAGGFKDWVLRINQNEPSEDFARSYLQDAQDFLQHIARYRQQQQTVEA